MAETYEITGQTMSEQRQADGSYSPVVEVGYKTKTDPPVVGTVTVPQSLLKDKVAYVEAVKSAVETAVDGHTAVASL